MIAGFLGDSNQIWQSAHTILAWLCEEKPGRRIREDSLEIPVQLRKARDYDSRSSASAMLPSSYNRLKYPCCR